MSTQENDKKKETKETLTQPEQPGAAQAAAREEQAAAAFVEAEAGATESATEREPSERAREIAERHLKTIPEADRKLTDPKQVDRLLYVLEDADDPGSHLFSIVDKLGNLPSRGIEAQAKGDAKGVAEAYRAFAKDPIGISKETDKVSLIANSTLSESVRTALLSIILKEGDYSAVAMMQDAVRALEHTHDIEALIGVRERYSTKEAREATSFRQEIVREFLKELYPDLVTSDEVSLLIKMTNLPYEQQSDKSIITSMVEQYNHLVEGVAFSRKYRELAGAQNGTEVLLKLQDGSISDEAITEVLDPLMRELRRLIAKKASSTEKR